MGITKYVQKSDNILELGCAAGRVSFNLYQLGYHNISGIDLSKNMILAARENAKKRNAKIDFQVDDAMNLSKPNNYYDCVLFMFNGLMLIPGIENRIKVLKEIRRVLKNKGTFIFTSHDINGNKKYQDFWLEEKEKWLKGEYNHQLYEYGDLNDSFIHFPSDEEIISMTTEQGYKIVFSDFRDNIAQENKNIKNFSENTKFWVLKK